MTPEDYRNSISSPDVFRRSELEESVRILQGTRRRHVDLLVKVLAEPPMPKPSKHQGGPDTDHFRVAIPQGTVSEMLDELLSAEAEAVAPNGSTTPLASRRAALVDRWHEYLRWLEERTV